MKVILRGLLAFFTARGALGGRRQRRGIQPFRKAQSRLSRQAVQPSLALVIPAAEHDTQERDAREEAHIQAEPITPSPLLGRGGSWCGGIGRLPRAAFS